MKRAERLIKLIRQQQRYAHSDCRKRKKNGYFVKQVIFPMVTRKEERHCEDVMKAVGDLAGVTLSECGRLVWVRLDKLKSTQRCLSIPRMVYQLRRHPLKERPVVIKLPGRGGFYELWDGNHRSASGFLLGCKSILCREVKDPRK